MARIVRFSDYEQRSREPDAVRDPTEPCIIVIMPVVRVERHEESLHPDELLWPADYVFPFSTSPY